MKQKYLLSVLLGLYAMLALTTMGSWSAKHLYSVTGDEPHYLIMSSGIVRHHTFEQTQPYADEFRTRAIYSIGLAAPGDQPTPGNTAAAQGPHGLYNIHNVGLPLLLALPYALGGALGAKLAMVVLGGLVIVLCWRISGLFATSSSHRFWAVAAVCIGLPLVASSNQIYPDIPAGMLALTGLYWLLTIERSRPLWVRVALATAVSYLPWLQIKFAAASLILIVALAIATARVFKQRHRVLEVVGPALVSFGLLAFYNWYAFGHLSGPYERDALQVNSTSLMTLVGLHIDQNQGFLVASPILLVGVYGVGQMWRRYRYFTVVSALVFLAFIVPNALHPNWYGGLSFSGRFAWSATIVFMVPTIFALLEIAKRSARWFYALVAVQLCYQAYTFVYYAILGAQLYNRSVAAPVDYSIYFDRLYRVLPLLYDRRVAYQNGVNYVAALFVALIFVVGFMKTNAVYRHRRLILLSVAVLAVADIFAAMHPPVS